MSVRRARIGWLARPGVLASVAVVVVALAAAGCAGARPSKAASPSSEDSSDEPFAKGAFSGPGGASSSPASSPSPSSTSSPTPSPSSAAALSPASSSPMPPPTPKKPGCFDSSRGAKHTFVGRLELHPNGSGAFRVKLPKRVCFSGGRFSAGETDEVVLDVDDMRAKPLLGKKVKVTGTSQDFAPMDQHAYVIRLEVTDLATDAGGGEKPPKRRPRP